VDDEEQEQLLQQMRALIDRRDGLNRLRGGRLWTRDQRHLREINDEIADLAARLHGHEPDPPIAR
jgi:hypothetical protein